MVQLLESPTPEALAAEIDVRIRALPDRRTKPLRTLRREFSRRVAKWPAADVLAVSLSLLDRPGMDHRFVAYELVSAHPAARASLGERELVAFGRDLDSWESVDTFGCYLSGPSWREGQVPDRLIHAWAQSDGRWWRRAALVSTVPLNLKARGGTGDTPRTLAVCALLVDDRDDMVVKAMSWALRELSRRDPDAVRAFMALHEDHLAARVKREVRHKLETGRKNLRRKREGAE